MLVGTERSCRAQFSVYWAKSRLGIRPVSWLSHRLRDFICFSWVNSEGIVPVAPMLPICLQHAWDE